MKVSDFDYELPESHIARYPPDERGSTRLLVLQRSTGEIMHSRYAGLHGFLRKGDLLVLNNSRVVKARMFAFKPTGGKIELVLLEKHGDEQNLVLYRGSLKKGDALLAYGCEFGVEELVGQGVAVLSVKGEGTVQDVFERYAAMPIPPYLKREAEEIDRERYQTVFAEQSGSVAAPTASLNMTGELFDSLRQKGVSIASMTLHVGLGTFLPIRVDHFDEHVMHREFYVIPDETIALIRTTKNNGGRVIAVGTTVTRALEHAADAVFNSNGNGSVSGEADIFIYPGYRFRVIDALLTNFHAPRSTVLMLTAAFAGAEKLFKAYSEALRSGYDFLSYGDSMLIL
ncbi:MAG: tRNA preQ1(34) S-adenosylmethionine ribosyltransferase-isomerase QueA [Chlorobium sp.]|jgi:S-adenosylmethionine:tRNA ribosyltransferase-isomerase|nr:tRNA preQ1(34) S-adenosylmethionine ribosyltransferase-isomerase QueA [Chlorobium sp.]